MFRRMIAVILVCCVCLLLTGCWSRRELNELAITVGLGIDKVGDNFIVSAQVVDPGQVAMKSGGGANRVPVTVFQETGKTIVETLRKMTTSAPRRIYLSHLRMLIIGEEMARSGISETLDFLSRGHETRTDFFIAIAKDARALDVLNVLTPLEKIPANNMFYSLETSAKFWAPTHGIFLDEMINNLSAEGKSPAVTGIQLKGNSSKGDSLNNILSVTPFAELEYAGLGAFHKDKLIGWLNDDESKGFNYIQGFVEQSIGHLECPDGGKIGTDVIRTHTRVKGNVVDGKPSILIRLYAEGDVAEVSCDIDLQNPDTIIKLSEQVNEEFVKLIYSPIRKAQQELKIDFLGFGNVFRKSYPKEWEQWKTNWNEMFTEMPVQVEIDYRIRRIGTITNSLTTETEE